MRKNKPSSTAFLIANGLAFLSTDPQFDSLISPQAAEMNRWFIEHTRLIKWLGPFITKRWFRTLIYALERMVLPGLMLHCLVRKRYLEEVVHQGLAEGFEQVVILGAGFDTLALRLHSDFENVSFFEIDHPATQRIKHRALVKKNLPRANLKLISIDFARQTLENGLLNQSEYDPLANTLFVAEGVLMYLDVEEVTALFRCIRQQSGPQSRFAFTFIETQPNGQIQFQNSSKAVNGWLRFFGEPFRWGIDRNALQHFLHVHGFSCEALATPNTFRKRYLDPHNLDDQPLPDGEYVCVAERILFEKIKTATQNLFFKP